MRRKTNIKLAGKTAARSIEIRISPLLSKVKRSRYTWQQTCGPDECYSHSGLMPMLDITQIRPAINSEVTVKADPKDTTPKA
jgi:hypothetical protein